MDINSLGTTTTTPVATSTAVKNASADFQTFLSLLTTQLRNQDPLKPMESTEFVAQLASFSAVEQQVRTNSTLDDIKALLSANSASGLAEWIGQEVQAPVAAAWNGSAVPVTWSPAQDADAVRINALDSLGRIVGQSTISENSGHFSWSGQFDSGDIAPYGSYRFVVESFSGVVLLDSQDATVAAKVTEIRWADDGARFVFSDGTELPATDFVQ